MVEIVKQSATESVRGNENGRVHLAGGADAVWDAFVAHHAYPQFLQTSAWAQLKSQFDWQATRAVVSAGGTGAPAMVVGGQWSCL